MKRLAVIDGKSVFYRGYYAMPNLSLPDGTPTGGVYGFASIAIELIKKLEPDYVAVAWDKPKTNIRKRRDIYPEYKAGRKPAPADFYAQVPLLHELLDAFGWPFYELDDYEADDILGAFAVQAKEKDIETCLLTSDLDALQLIDSHTKVFAIKNGLSNIEEFDVDYFEKKYGIEVEQFLDLKSLKGDSSDNLPGVPGIGEKGAVALLQEFKTLDGIYEHLDDIKPTIAKKLEAGKELAYMSKEVGRIWTDAPVKLDWDKASIEDIDLQKVSEILHRLEFNSLAKRLPKHMQFDGKTAEVVDTPAAEALIKVDWPETLEIDGPVLLEIIDDEVWISTDRKTVASTSIKKVHKSVWKALEMTTVVSYDIKQIYHTLAAHDIFVRFDDIHDLRQGAFLVDPLKRDRSAGGLIGQEDPEPAALIAGLWKVYDDQLAFFKDEPRIAKIAHDFDFPLTYTLFKMEYRGITLDKTKMKNVSKELDKDIVQFEKEIYKLSGSEFNLNSPAQVSEILFDKLGLPTTGIKRVKSGFYSTDISTLNKLQGSHPMIDVFIKYREYAKLKGTYADTLPLQVDGKSKLHTTYSQDTAATGRLSSDSPNLQQIPTRTKLGLKIKSAFVADPDKVFVSADYSQFELRLAAILAGDTELINDFNGDVDIHTKTASDVYGIPMDEVTKNQRRDAKVINFGVLYGMSPHGLAANTGMSIVQAKDFIDQYFTLRAPIRKFIDETLNKGRTEGYVETYYGRRRPTPDITSSNFMVRSGAERAAANMPIQGTEADLMKLAMLRVDEKLGDLGEQVLQIHDSILVECPKEKAEKVSEILKNTMESIAPELKIKLRVDVSVGKSWGDL